MSVAEEEAKAIALELKTKTLALVKELGKDAAKTLTEEQLADFDKLTIVMGKAILGDEGAKLKLEASLSLRYFSAEAQSYLKSAKFLKALSEALVEAAEAALKVAGKLVAHQLAELLKEGLEG